jgi:hypothetical protein
MKKVTVEFTHGTNSCTYNFLCLASLFDRFSTSLYMSFQPQRRSSCLSSNWILVADCTGSALEKYHLVQLDGSSITENAVESSFAHCAENLLDYIGKMATK